MTVSPRHPFDRCGFGALSDLATPECRALLQELGAEQDRFLAHEGAFRSPEYKWPRDALRWWSRVWEYPYAMHHLRRWRAGVPGRVPVVADVGSGVTFFPFSVARLGCEVICLDIDPIAGRDLGRAAAVVDAAPGRVAFRQVTGGQLPLADGEVDAVYCVSVIEHVPDFTGMVADVARALRPGGLFVVTVDVDLMGGPALGIGEARRLLDAIDERFERIVPERPVHPLDLLVSDTGPHPWRVPPFGLERRVRNTVRRLRGRRPRVDPRIAVHGMALTRRP